MKVYKYNLCPGMCQVALPEGYRILSIGWQGEDLVFWALVSEGKNFDTVSFLVAVTGQDISGYDFGKHIGTAESDDGFVAHVFELYVKR